MSYYDSNSSNNVNNCLQHTPTCLNGSSNVLEHNLKDLSANKTKICKDKTASTKNRIVLILGVHAFFLEGCAMSLMGPFYPEVASKRGVSTFLTFAVFGVYALTKFVSSPLYGMCLLTTQPRTLLLCGFVVGGVSNIAFGALDKMCDSGTCFIIISFVFRALDALGCSAFATALCAIVTNMFTDKAASAVSYLEAANGVGLMAGPAIGGALYDVAGFGLPFYAIGVLVVVNGCALHAVVEPLPADNKEIKIIPYLSIIRHPMVIVALSSTLTGSLSDSFMEPTLSVYLKPFHYSTSVVGLFFMLYCSAFTIVCPIIGFLSDKFGIHEQLIVCGHLLTALGLLLLGFSKSETFRFIPFDVWVVITGIVLTGVPLGCMFIPTFKCFLIGFKNAGWDEGMETLGLVAGVSNGVYCLGAFLGSTLGGLLVSQIGYPNGYIVVGLVHTFMVMFSSLLFLCCRC